MFLQLLTYAGIACGLALLVFLIATGLYYISEELEAHTVASKKYITRFIYFVMAMHVLLCLFDGLPIKLSAWSLLANNRYLAVMKSFPVIKFSDTNFIVACVGAITNHFFWFWHFNDNDLPPYTIYERIPTYEGETLPPFSQVASFFGILVWTVPFLLFLSLSANDNALPLSNDADRVKPQRKGLARHVLDQAWQFILQYIPASWLNRDSDHVMPI